jgi:hypothetical protein
LGIQILKEVSVVPNFKELLCKEEIFSNPITLSLSKCVIEGWTLLDLISYIASFDELVLSEIEVLRMHG